VIADAKLRGQHSLAVQTDRLSTSNIEQLLVLLQRKQESYEHLSDAQLVDLIERRDFE